MLDGESMTTATHKWNGHAFIKKKKKTETVMQYSHNVLM